MGIEGKINYHLNKCPTVKKVIKRIYQKTMYTISPKIKSEGNIVRISPHDIGHEYFFGYYDKSPWDSTDRYMLCLKADDTWSEVSPKHSAQIILIDTARNNEITVLAETHSWNVQQGCMLQWLGPEYMDRIIYNDFREGKYCSIILRLSFDKRGIKTIEEKIIPAPVYSVASDGTFAMTLDFSRLHRLRPGYGYCNLPEKTIGEKLPDKPCIWRVDLVTNDVSPVLKYTDFAFFRPRLEMDGAEHKVNHIMLSPNAKRFMVLYRWFQGDRKYTRLITCNVDGTDMYLLSDDDMVSHCFWRTNNQIFAFENKKYGLKGDQAGNGYYLMKDKTQEYRRFWPGIDFDGHPSYSPDGEKVVFDRYPDRTRVASVMISDAKNRKDSGVKTVARVFAPFKYDNDTRCDLHPRWNHFGNKVCFDSVFEGHRGLYVVELSEREGNNKQVKSDMERKKEPLITVIVPVYNVENYLKRCADSIIKQTYRNLEIILVDDGSTDSSGRICDEIAARDKRIVVIHKENGGLSSARNVGIRVSTGNYIGFVDSDDWIACDMYEYLLWLLLHSNSEIAQIGFKPVKEYSFKTSKGNLSEKVFVGKEILQNYMTTTTTTGSYSVCRCLFKRETIMNLKFREGKVNEDIDFKYKALANCNRFVQSNSVKYFYFQSIGSTTTSGLKKRDFDLYDAAEELFKLTRNETYGNIKFLGEIKKKRTAFSLLSRIAYFGIDDPSIDRKETVKVLTKELRSNLFTLLSSPMKISRKIVAVLLSINIYFVEIPLKVFKFLNP